MSCCLVLFNLKNNYCKILFKDRPRYVVAILNLAGLILKKNHDLILLCFYSIIILGICGEDNNLPSFSYWSDRTALVFLYTKIRNC